MSDSSVLDDVDEAIQEIAQPLVERREKVIEHRQKLIEQKEETDEVLRRIERALRPLRPDLFEPKVKPKQTSGQTRIGTRTASGTATGTGITVEGCEPYVKEIKAQIAQGSEYVTQIGVYKKIRGSDQTRSSAAFRYLRQIGFLRKGGIQNHREMWYIDRPDAYDQAIAGLEETT